MHGRNLSRTASEFGNSSIEQQRSYQRYIKEVSRMLNLTCSIQLKTCSHVFSLGNTSNYCIFDIVAKGILPSFHKLTTWTTILFHLCCEMFDLLLELCFQAPIPDCTNALIALNLELALENNSSTDNIPCPNVIVARCIINLRPHFSYDFTCTSLQF